MDKTLKPDNGKWKNLRELDPELYRLRCEWKEEVAVHYFCNECDYHFRRVFEIPYSIANDFKRAINVPHGAHN